MPARNRFAFPGERRRVSIRRAAFTLMEVIVAMLLASMVVLGARALADALVLQATETSTSMQRIDRDVNAERFLRGVVGRLERGDSLTGRFTGGPDSVAFSSWCDTAHGWQERCRIRIVAVRQRAAASLVVRLSTGEVLLLRSARSVSLRYLTDATNGGSWTDSWTDMVHLPPAIGVLSDRDTLILRVGDRG